MWVRLRVSRRFSTIKQDVHLYWPLNMGTLGSSKKAAMQQWGSPDVWTDVFMGAERQHDDWKGGESKDGGRTFFVSVFLACLGARRILSFSFQVLHHFVGSHSEFECRRNVSRPILLVLFPLCCLPFHSVMSHSILLCLFPFCCVALFFICCLKFVSLFRVFVHIVLCWCIVVVFVRSRGVCALLLCLRLSVIALPCNAC